MDGDIETFEISRIVSMVSILWKHRERAATAVRKLATNLAREVREVVCSQLHRQHFDDRHAAPGGAGNVDCIIVIISSVHLNNKYMGASE